MAYSGTPLPLPLHLLPGAIEALLTDRSVNNIIGDLKQ
jgi:hypothetical protein